jgi:hypothetical protein
MRRIPVLEITIQAPQRPTRGRGWRSKKEGTIKDKLAQRRLVGKLQEGKRSSKQTALTPFYKLPKKQMNMTTEQLVVAFL